MVVSVTYAAQGVLPPIDENVVSQERMLQSAAHASHQVADDGVQIHGAGGANAVHNWLVSFVQIHLFYLYIYDWTCIMNLYNWTVFLFSIIYLFL